MTIVKLSNIAFDELKSILPTDIIINPTQITRIALLHLKQSKLSGEKIFSLIGMTATDQLFIDSLKAKK